MGIVINLSDYRKTQKVENPVIIERDEVDDNASLIVDASQEAMEAIIAVMAKNGINIANHEACADAYVVREIIQAMIERTMGHDTDRVTDLHDLRHKYIGF